MGISTDSNFSRTIQTSLVEALSPQIFRRSSQPESEENSDGNLERICEAYENPLDYPPLSQTVFPGDKVAIALQTGLPQPAMVLTSLLRQLQRSQIAAGDIVVVASAATASILGMPASEIEAATNPMNNDGPQSRSFELDGFQVNLLIHLLNAPASVAYLAANEAGDPIYLNRCLVDADVVLPVGFSQASRDQTADSLYPEFSNAETQRRFDSGDFGRQDQEKEIQLANDTLGSFYSIRVVAGPGGKIDSVITGARASVMAEANRHAGQVWKYHGPVDCGIVVVTIEAASGTANWDDFVQALIAADEISAANSPIVVWSDLKVRPAKHIRQAMLAQFDESASKKFSPTLFKLIDIMQEHPIFLYSQLTRDEVESLGIGYVDSAAQINRIGEACERGVVLRDAHKWAFDNSGSPKARISGQR